MRENIRLMVAESFLTVLEAKEARDDKAAFRPDTNPALARNVRGLSPRSDRSNKTAAALLAAGLLGVGVAGVVNVVSDIQNKLQTDAEIKQREREILGKPLPKLPFQK